MNTPITTDARNDLDLQLVDLDDLRAAFGGEAGLALSTETAVAPAAPPTSTVMCPSW